MTTETTVCKIGDSLGIVLPKEAVAALKLVEGSRLFVSGDGAEVRISAERPSVDEAMRVAERGMTKYADALRKLAK